MSRDTVDRSPPIPSESHFGAAQGADGVSNLEALTSLRFFAAFYVLVLHSGSTALMRSRRLPGFVCSFLSNGYLGVNFFFVLSGFILAHVYIGRLDSSYFSGPTWRYAVARFARIYPVYLLALLLTLSAAPGAFAWARLLQLGLLQLWIPPALAPQIPPNDNGPAWTLSVEFFFYLTFPLILRWLLRWTTYRPVYLLGVLLVVMFACLLPAAGTGHHRANTLVGWRAYVPVPCLRLPEFVYGVSLGIVYERKIVPLRPGLVYAAVGGTLLTLCAASDPWVAPCATVVFGALILVVAVSLPETALAKLLRSRTLVLLGGASYALYLLQQPVHLWLWRAVGDQRTWIAKATYAPLLTLSSVVVFRYYETPLREWLKRSLDPRRSLAPMAESTEKEC